MNRRYCDTGRIECPHLPECKWDCHHSTNKIIPIRLAKAVEEADAAPDHWCRLWQFLIGLAFAALAAVFAVLLLTGIWIWGLLL